MFNEVNNSFSAVVTTASQVGFVSDLLTRWLRIHELK